MVSNGYKAKEDVQEVRGIPLPQALKVSNVLLYNFTLLPQHFTELNLKDITETVQEVGAVEFSKVLESLGLNQMLDQANYTIFAPTDEKFKQYEPPRVSADYHLNLAFTVAPS